MAAGIADLIIEQGATFKRTLTLRGPAPGNLPIDVSGHTFRGEVRTATNAAGVIATFVFTKPNLGVDGVVEMTLGAAVTELLPVTGAKYSAYTKYQYDVEMEDSGGVVTRLLNGQVSVSPEVTK